MTKRIALIDGDMLLFRAASAVETETQWDDDLYTLHSDVSESFDYAKKFLDELVQKASATEFKLCLSAPGSRYFRHDIAADYKAKRGRKPVAFKALIERAKEQWGSVIKPMLEADDVMGIMQTALKDETVIVSGDKDMRQIPGLHLDLLNAYLGVETVGAFEADYLFMLQTLTGDTTDNYTGCPKVGPKKAEDILKPAIESENFIETAWPLVVAAFKKAGQDEQEAIRQARLARILRSDDYNFKTEAAVLWNPPTIGEVA